MDFMPDKIILIEAEWSLTKDRIKDRLGNSQDVDNSRIDELSVK